MLDLSSVPAIVSMGNTKLAVLKMIYKYSYDLSRFSPVTVQWIPLSQWLCAYMLTSIPQTYVYSALNELEADEYLDSKRFDEISPECRCKLYKLTDKFYELIKGVK